MEARRAVDADPEHALRLLGDHERLYPRGSLAPERDVLTIEVLARLRRVAEVEARARQHMRDYPESAYRERIRAAMRSLVRL